MMDTLNTSLNQSLTQIITSITALVGVHHDADDQLVADTCHPWRADCVHDAPDADHVEVAEALR